MAPPPKIHSLNDLLARLDQALDRGANDLSRCAEVKGCLESACLAGDSWLPQHYLTPNPDRYARHLVHRDPRGRYSVVAMVWGSGQGTPLHDHSGTWCVECVYRGRIEVVSYSRRANVDSELGVLDFAEESRAVAGVGEAGALIPPFEYHTIANAGSAPATTLHVYGGEIKQCRIYEPAAGGGYLPRVIELCYTT
jgi:predicted metal-dependent enzyme (double-stranded beta helix superfamily)